METAILTPFAYDPKKVRLYLMTQRVTGYAADTKIVVSRNSLTTLLKIDHSSSF